MKIVVLIVAILGVRGKNRDESEDSSFMASILQQGLHYCAGSIVTPLFVLTAAYCCFDNDGELLPVEDMEVSIGSESWRKGERYPIANVYVHKSYSGVDFQSNVALLKLQKAIVPDDDFARAIILNQNFVDEDDALIRGTVIGWGTLTPKGKFASKGTGALTKTDLVSITATKCSFVYGRIFAEELCMVSEPSEEDDEENCSGDAGGPLVVRSGDVIAQIGIVSYTTNCSNSLPGVYTRISTYYPWIKATLDKARRNAL